MIDRPTPTGAVGFAVPPWNSLFTLSAEAFPAGPVAADVLARVLDPTREPLPPFDPAPVADSSRPPAEAHALAAAVACPDLFLFDTVPGPGRAAIAATLLAELVASGSRVLVVAPASLSDLIVNRMVDRNGTVSVVRALAPGESPDRLLPTAASRTSTLLAEKFLVATRQKLVNQAAIADATLARLNTVPAELASFRDTIDRLARLTEREVAAKQDRSRAASQGEVAAEPLKARLADELARIDATKREASVTLDSRNAELATLRTQLDAATAEAKKRHGAVGFLKSLFARDDPATLVAELQPRLADVEAAAQSAAAELARITAERDALASAHRDELALFVRTETARRECDVDAKLHELAREREPLDTLCREQQQFLAANGIVWPTPPTLTDIDRIVADIFARRETAIEERETVRRCEAELDAGDPQLVSRALAGVRVVVAPPAAVGTDPLVPASNACPVFDRLVIADADSLTEADFLTLAQYAARWILIGDGSSPLPGAGVHRNGKLPLTSRPGFFSKLWNRMHRRTWTLEAGRLLARLTDTPRSGLRAEPLADRPQVELRFVDEANGEILLAEVAFPHDFTAVDAKQFLIAELGEVRLAPCGAVRWHETADRLTACFPAAETGQRVVGWVDLERGVREKVTGTGSEVYTAAVQFEKAAGWDRAAAEVWLNRHSPEPTPVRTAAVPRPTPTHTPDPAREMAGVAG